MICQSLIKAVDLFLSLNSSWFLHNIVNFLISISLENIDRVMYDRNKFNWFSTAGNLRCLSRIKAILPKNSQKFYCCILGIYKQQISQTLFYYIHFWGIAENEQVKGRIFIRQWEGRKDCEDCWKWRKYNWWYWFNTIWWSLRNDVKMENKWTLFICDNIIYKWET